MENRERDRVSQRTSSTEAGDINRRTSEEKGREISGTDTEFGQNIGRSENLDEGKKGGSMDNRNKNNRPNFDEESSRRPSDESGYGSSQGRQGSSDVERESGMNKSQGDRSGRSSSGDRNIGSSSEGEH